MNGEISIAFPLLRTFNIERLLLSQVFEYIGWTKEEIVDACGDFKVPLPDFYWEEVMIRLWASSYLRIRRNLDKQRKFKGYGEWREMVPAALGVNRTKFIINDNTDELTLQEVEAVLVKQKVSLLPAELAEKRVLWALVFLIVQLHNYMHRNPTTTIKQVNEIINTVRKNREELEKKREARFHRRQAQKQKKRNKH